MDLANKIPRFRRFRTESREKLKDENGVSKKMLFTVVMQTTGDFGRKMASIERVTGRIIFPFDFVQFFIN